MRMPKFFLFFPCFPGVLSVVLEYLPIFSLRYFSRFSLLVQPDGFAAPHFFPPVVAVKVKNKNFCIFLLYIIIHLTFETYILYNHYLLLCAKFICYLNKCQIWDPVKPLASVTITVNSGVYSDSVRETFISLILTIQPLKFHRVYLFLCYEKRVTTSPDHSLFCILSLCPHLFISFPRNFPQRNIPLGSW